MYTRWTKNLSDQDKKQWIADVQAAQPTLKEVVKLLKEDLKSSSIRLKERDSYDKASWPFYVSDLLGEQRAFEKAIKLIENLIGENS